MLQSIQVLINTHTNNVKSVTSLSTSYRFSMLAYTKSRSKSFKSDNSTEGTEMYNVFVVSFLR